MTVRVAIRRFAIFNTLIGVLLLLDALQSGMRHDWDAPSLLRLLDPAAFLGFGAWVLLWNPAGTSAQMAWLWWGYALAVGAVSISLLFEGALVLQRAGIW
ncbi:MAG: hypothetical protein ACOYL5_05340 [Phototrophicaceae bacterium]|jgi:hypothetical protein